MNIYTYDGTNEISFSSPQELAEHIALLSEMLASYLANGSGFVKVAATVEERGKFFPGVIQYNVYPPEQK